MHERTKDEVLEREFLTVRAKILEVAAALDRLGRAGGEIGDGDRRAKLEQGIRILLEEEPDRAERVQLAFSRHYAPDWRQQFDV